MTSNILPAVAIRNVNILLIDDDQDDYLLVRDMLEEVPYYSAHLEWVDNFERGRELLLKGSHDIYFVDYYLGPGHGLSIIREAVQMGIIAPMILLTGREDPDVDLAAASAGAADYLVKGQLSPVLLGRAIRYALAHGQTLEEIRQSETRFRALIEASPDAVFVHRNDKIFYVNPTAIAYLGYERSDQLVGLSMADIVHHDDVDELFEYWTTIRLGQSTIPREIRMLRANGDIVVAEYLEHGLEFEGQSSTMAIVRDITEKKQMRTRMMLSERMASLGSMAAGVAHEINNPLAYVLANIELALQTIQTNVIQSVNYTQRCELEDILTMLSHAKNGAERVRHIVRDLRQFSSSDDQAYTRVNVQSVLDSALALAQNEVRHRAHVVKNYQNPPPVFVNEARLGQVFLNLIVNAAQAMPGGTASQNIIELRTWADDSNNVIIQVADTGPGIEPGVIDRIFEPFFTTKPVGEGMGLGLSICHSIVHAFGGELTVQSKVGQGTIFTVVLPLRAYDTSQNEAITESDTQTELQRALEKPLNIIVIDDEPMIGDIITRIFEPKHKVTAFVNGTHALREINQHRHIDLIFCDLMMPDKTGMDIYDDILEINPALARNIVFMTGGIFTTQAREFLSSVPNTVLEKPFSLERIRDVAAQIVQEGAR